MNETPSLCGLLVPLSLVLAALAAVACSPGESQGPDVPDVRGTYEGLWDMSMQSLDGTDRQGAECRGTVTVASQTDTSFTGTFRVDSAGEATGDLSCRVVEGELQNARIGTGGLSRFRPVAGDAGVAAALSGCGGSAPWQGDFTLTPDLPEEGRLDAGAKFTLRCDQADGSGRNWDTQIQFRGSEP